MKRVVACLFGVILSSAVAQGTYLFAYSNSDNPSLLVLNGGAITISTAIDPISNGHNNQGWWSTTASNSDANTNVITGLYNSNLYNDFFSFSLAGIQGPITSATLRIVGPFSHGTLPLTYSIFDVSTDPATLNYNEGYSQAFYDDLGSGVLFGSIFVSSLTDPTDVPLNAAGLAALNAAIGQARYFSIGGTVSPSSPIPEPAAVFLIGSALAGLGLLRRFRA